jgi:hypothetical protein
VAACERLEIDGCILWGALLPTPLEEADPCAGQGSHGRLGCLALIALRRIIDRCPAGMPGGCRRPRDQRVSQALWALEAPVAPGRLAAACRARREARSCWEGVGGRHAGPWFAAGAAEAGRTHGPSPWRGGKHRAGGLVLGAWGAGGVEVGTGRQGDPALGDEGVPAAAMGAMTPAAVVSARALWMASRRVVRTSAERTWWARQKPSQVGRRARGTALRGGQRRRTWPQSTGACA